MTNKTESEIDVLKARLAELERAMRPPAPLDVKVQRYDPTARMTMPPSALREMVNGVPDSVVRDLAYVIAERQAARAARA
jgi:hypothetical protein